MAPARFSTDQDGDISRFYLPGADFVYGKVEEAAGYNTEGVYVYPMFHLVYFWIFLATTIFFIAMPIVSFIELYPENTFIDRTLYDGFWWGMGGGLVLLSWVFGVWNLMWFRVMSLWTRFSNLCFLLVILWVYLTGTALLIGLRITYPHLDKTQIQVNMDWKNAMLWIATSIYPVCFAAAIQFMALWHPVKAVSALSKGEIQAFYNYLRDKAESSVTA